VLIFSLQDSIFWRKIPADTEKQLKDVISSDDISPENEKDTIAIERNSVSTVSSFSYKHHD
jgi:hypothetical protein